jgi:hypothetical protein
MILSGSTACRCATSRTAALSLTPCTWPSSRSASHPRTTQALVAFGTRMASRNTWNLEAVAGLREQWLLIQQASGLMVDPGEAVFSNFRSQLLGMFARRYALMHSHLLAGTSSADKSVRLASREVLSHSARQCLEIKVYLKQFFDDVSSRAGTVGAGWTFQQRAAFVHSRVEKVFGPAVRVFLETEGAAPRSAVMGFAGSAALGRAAPAPLLGQVASSWLAPASQFLSIGS